MGGWTPNPIMKRIQPETVVLKKAVPETEIIIKYMPTFKIILHNLRKVLHSPMIAAK